MSSTDDDEAHPAEPDLPDYHRRAAAEGWAAPTNPGWAGRMPADLVEPAVGMQPAARRTGGAAAMAALVLAGALIGGVGVAAVAHGGAGSTTAGGSAAAAGHPDQLGAPPGDDEVQVSGTLRSVDPSSIRLHTAHGTSTYPVTAATQVLAQGELASLSDLRSGQPVLVHLVPSGSSMSVDRIIAGNPGFGAPAGGDEGGDGTST
jgi:hypothetical protein